MLEIYLYTLGSVIIVSLISLVGLFFLSVKEDFLHKILFVLVSIAAGALFGDALIHLIPEAIHDGENTTLISFFILLGVLIFFALEKFLRWQHVHDINTNGDGGSHIHGDHLHLEDSELHNHHIRPIGRLVIISDGMHNFIDGIIIAGGYFISIEVGIATTIAIILHEIPQEVGDFGVLVHAGYTRWRALLVNFLTALTALVGAIITLLAGSFVQNFIPYIVAIAGGSFLYIAGSDLIPEIHKTSDVKRSLLQFLGLLIGITLMFLLLFLEV